MLLSCFVSTQLDFGDRFRRYVESSLARRFTVEFSPDYIQLLFNGNWGKDVKGLIFEVQNSNILALYTHKSDILKDILTLLSESGVVEKSYQFSPLTFSQQYFSSWLKRSSQIIQCTLVSYQTNGATMLSGDNLLDSSLFGEVSNQARIKRMMFSMKGDEKYLVTAKENGKIIINPDTNDHEVYRILKLLLNPIGVTEA